MKKVFISVPMKGRTNTAIEESIKQMHKIAEVIFGEELEPIDNFFDYEDTGVGNHSIYCLGEAIKKMSLADYFIGLDYCGCFRGCYMEREVATVYNIPSYYIHMHNIKWLEDAVRIDSENNKYNYECTEAVY